MNERRPRRTRVTKQGDYNTGVPWWEEQIVKRALHLSLKDHKPQRRSEAARDAVPLSGASVDGEGSIYDGELLDSSEDSSATDSDLQVRYDEHQTWTQALVTSCLPAHRPAADSGPSEKRPRRVAPRKFAQAGPCIRQPFRATRLRRHASNVPQRSVQNGKISDQKDGSGEKLHDGANRSAVIENLPCTEDFLTFLCLRGTAALPATILWKNPGRDSCSKIGDGEDDEGSGEDEGDGRICLPAYGHRPTPRCLPASHRPGSPCKAKAVNSRAFRPSPGHFLHRVCTIGLRRKGLRERPGVIAWSRGLINNHPAHPSTLARLPKYSSSMLTIPEVLGHRQIGDFPETEGSVLPTAVISPLGQPSTTVGAVVRERSHVTEPHSKRLSLSSQKWMKTVQGSQVPKRALHRRTNKNGTGSHDCPKGIGETEQCKNRKCHEPTVLQSKLVNGNTAAMAAPGNQEDKQVIEKDCAVQENEEASAAIRESTEFLGNCTPLPKSLPGDDGPEQFGLNQKKDMQKQRRLPNGAVESPNTTDHEHSNGPKLKPDLHNGNSAQDPVNINKPTETHSMPKLLSTPHLPPLSALPDVPVFRPTDKEFHDPVAFIEGIRAAAEHCGMCRVVPPPSWRPECRLDEGMRFVTRVQHVHKLAQRWGPNVQRLACIRKCLRRQGICLDELPLIGGCELDLASLSMLTEMLGGTQNLRDARCWQRLADDLGVPRSSQDRLARLQEAYCRYLVPYEELSAEERQKLEDEVEEEHVRLQSEEQPHRCNHGDWVDSALGLWAGIRPCGRAASTCDLPLNGSSLEGGLRFGRQTGVKVKHLATVDQKHEDNGVLKDLHKCCFKGKSVSLAMFYRIARNALSSFSSKEPTGSQAEERYWDVVEKRKAHVTVHCAKIDTNFYASGFPISRSEPFSRHGWNLTELPSNPNSTLRHLGALSGVTVPWLNIRMLFSTSIWSRNPFHLPCIDYMHTGADNIWYSVPASQQQQLEEVVKSLLQEVGQDLTGLELLQTSMVSPSALHHAGVLVYRTVQQSGQFLVTFPGAFTASVSCGYCVSEAIPYGPTSWLPTGYQAAKEVRRLRAPSAFPMDKLLYLTALGELDHGNLPALVQVEALIEQLRDREVLLRKQLFAGGLQASARYGCHDNLHPSITEVRKRPRKWLPIEASERRCQTCQQLCYLSMVVEESENVVFCLECSLTHLGTYKSPNEKLKLMYRYDKEQMDALLDNLRSFLNAHKADL
uniref:Jumonji and AT-rich interaction domain containing 2 n=1 Tax=Eptatretus burgeri TaxID=7764 RepID=A0A8C4NGA0_EPTBU